ncbi:hypothetical protein IQ250_12020 [Pseudanabaenaceae cyanobacterium LEGE 13415]|nr:hypothetical protein [Pseudanabaenaceae cyanobacterium LEGE 13415]
MKALFRSLLVLPFAIAALQSNPALAIPIVQQVSQTQAQGLAGNGATVTVWLGNGTNIDFTRTGETIQRAWLDDAHAITLDFDAALDGRGNASILHLKRVTGIHFPNLPETRSTLLTVVTRSPYGKKTYLFDVHYGSGTPKYATLAVVPDAQPLTGGVALADRTANWNDVERGLQRAIAQRLIPAQSPINQRVQIFLANVRNGMPMQQAATQAKVSLAVVSKLAQMGTNAVSRPGLLMLTK